MRGKKGPVPEAVTETPEVPVTTANEVDPSIPAEPDPRPEPIEQVYACKCGEFSGTWEEWSEHSSGTGHTDFDQHDKEPVEPEQAVLFDTEGIVQRYVNVAVTESWLNEARCNMER